MMLNRHEGFRGYRLFFLVCDTLQPTFNVKENDFISHPCKTQ